MNIDNYLEKIVQLTANTGYEIENHSDTQAINKQRWICTKDGIKYVLNPDSSADQKLEKILLNMKKKLHEQVKLGHFASDVNKINSLRTMINEKVKGYNERHVGMLGFMYKFFSKVIYGDINELNNDVLQELDTLQAAPFISRFHEITQRMGNTPHFEDIQELKKIKKEAKILFQNKDTKTLVEIGLEQEVFISYDQIVAGIDVLSILKKISREIRCPEMKPCRWTSAQESKSVVSTRFSSLIDCNKEDKNIYELANIYKDKKQEWEIHWNTIRKRIWNASEEAKDFLQQDKKITFITGSKSSTIPLIIKIPHLAPHLGEKPALIPTGELLRNHIAPLTGELGYGILENGINQIALSGMRFAGLTTCMSYATAKGMNFQAEKEIEKIFSTREMAPSFVLPTLQVAIIRLLLMGEKKEEYDRIKKYITQLINSEKNTPPLKKEWARFATLTGLPCSQQPSRPTKELQRGEVVAVPRTGSTLPKYGIIVDRNDDESYTVVVEKDGTKKIVSSNSITVIDETALIAEICSKQGIDSRTESLFGNLLKSKKEQLQELLELFSTVKPISWDPEELSLIRQPCPVVWASVTVKPEVFNAGIRGEHILRTHAVLGDQIQFAFTNQANVDKLQNVLAKYKVQVLSIEAARFILGKEQERKYSSLWE